MDIDPIHRDLSLFGGLSCSLIEQPEIMLEGAGMIYLPVELVMKLINIVLKPILSWLVLDPRCVTLSLADEQIHWPQLELPAGMLRIFLLEGRDLIAADRSIFGTCGFKKRGSSDPFCKLVVDRMIIYSNVVDKTTNPVWKFYAEFPIIDPSKQELIMELYDEDIGAESDYLGETSVRISSLDLKGMVSESWLDVRTVDASTGQIRARLQWVPCQPSTASSVLYRRRPYTESCSQAILAVHIRRVQTNSKIEPVVCLQISGGQLQTTTKGNSGQEYEFEEEMMLLVRDLDTDWVRFALLDLNKNSFNAGRMFKKGLSLLHGGNDALSSDLIAHKGKEVLNMPLVGDSCFPVKMFTDKRELTCRLRSKGGVEARICFTAKLEFLEVPIENMM